MAPPHLAWIGLGNMGRGMCKNLVEKGNLDHPLVIFNRTKSRADALAEKLGEKNVKIAESVKETVSSADIIFTCVGDDRAVDEVMEAALQVDVTGKLFVDCSTVHPETTNAMAIAIGARNADFVACPVFGAPAMADSGQLICVLAGASEVIEKVKPYTTGVMGRGIIDFGNQEHGNATLLKIIGNTMVFNMVESVAEGLTFADKSRLGVDNFQKFLEMMFPGPFSAYATRMRTGDYHKREEPLFAVDLALKDVNHAIAMANSYDVKLPQLEVAKEHLLDVKDHMGERGDIAAMYGANRLESGMRFEN